MLKILKKLSCAALLCLSSFAAIAHDYTLGDITINHPWARATPPKAVNSGVFMQLTSKSADQLLFASSEMADKAEVHEMKMVDGVMKMRQLPTGVELAPNQSVKLAPGSFHIMLFGIKQVLKEGDQFPLTLTFAKAGKITVDVKVQAMTDLTADTPTHSHN